MRFAALNVGKSLTRIAGAIPVLGVLGADPAAAQTPVTQAMQDRHYESLWSPRGRLCFERQKRETLELEAAVAVCLESLDALAQKRGALRSPKPFELANFDYVEASLLSGLGAAYARRDRSDTTMTCAAMERMWVITTRLRTISKDAVTETWHGSYQRLSESLTEVMRLCRARNGTPEGAPPVS